MHLNNGNCSKCGQIFDRYPGFNQILRVWFRLFQRRHPEAHISCAGRGKLDQEAAFTNRVSKAHYGESAHNWNAAIDIFEMLDDGQHNIYERAWFCDVLEPELENYLNWYGKAGSPYYELPHIELRAWRDARDSGVLKLVE